MGKEVHQYGPKTPGYTEKSQAIAGLVGADPKSVTVDSLLRSLGGYLNEDDRLSGGKQAPDLIVALNRVGLLTYQGDFSQSDEEPEKVDAMRRRVETDGRLQGVAIGMIPSLLDGSAAPMEKMEKLKVLLNTAHAAGFRETEDFNGDEPGYVPGLELLQQAESHIFEKLIPERLDYLRNQGVLTEEECDAFTGVDDIEAMKNQVGYEAVLLASMLQRTGWVKTPRQMFTLLQEVLYLGYAMGARGKLHALEQQE